MEKDKVDKCDEKPEEPQPDLEIMPEKIGKQEEEEKSETQQETQIQKQEKPSPTSPTQKPPEEEKVEDPIMCKITTTYQPPPNFGVCQSLLTLPQPKEIFRQNLLRIVSILSNPEEYFGKIGRVGGWVKTTRNADGKTILFIELNDGSCQKNIQILVKNKMPGFERLLKARTGWSFKVRGTFTKSEGKGQEIELLCEDPTIHKVEICGEIENPKRYPISKKYTKPETLRKNAHLRSRTNLIGGIARIRNALAFATHVFFQSRGYLYVHTPVITASDCEGAGEMFQVTTVLPKPLTPFHPKQIPQKKKKIEGKKQPIIDYKKDFFKRPAFLTVSGQLAVEGYCCSLTNVYTFGPTFRAENSNTSRHLAEFWMIEPEIAFGDLEDLMEVAESYIKFLVKYCLDNLKDDMDFFSKRKGKENLKTYLNNLIEKPYVRLTYTEGIKILENHVAEGKVQFEEPVSWGIDLGSEHERYLCEKVFKGPVIHYNYPKDIKAFYMRVNDDNKTVAAMDVLVPQIGEIIGGSQREERLDKLDQRIKEMNLDKESYWWYRDLRRYGTVKHSGFGLGFERVVMMISGLDNIRDSIPYPRFPGAAEF